VLLVSWYGYKIKSKKLSKICRKNNNAGIALEGAERESENPANNSVNKRKEMMMKKKSQ
jgi:hypothetical protein